MPELPEVETTCRGLQLKICGKTITHVIVRNSNLRLPVTKELTTLAVNQTILSINRRAKYIIITLTNSYILIHLGMTGSLRYLPSSTIINKHDHADIVLGDVCIRYTDHRRFGCILWLKEDPLTHSLLKDAGPEPLTKEFNAQYLIALKRKTAIKSMIMDNKVVVGVGNIYATEALYLSRIHPGKATNLLSIAQVILLINNIKAILIAAIEQGGTTFKDFVNSEGKPGLFAQNLHVYGREHLPCYTCNTTIQAIKLGQRTSAFCPQCQQL